MDVRGRARPAIPVPTVRGAALATFGLIAFVCSLVWHRTDLFFVGLLLLLAVAGAHLALLLPGPRLTAQRMIRPDAVNAGEDAAVTVVVRSVDGRPVRLHHWRDEVPHGVIAGRGAAAGPVPGDPGAAVVHTSIHAARRGVYRVGPLRVQRTDPLGLATVDVLVGRAEPLLVRPRVAELGASPLDESAAGGVELVVMRRTTPAVDEVSARDYERGDPMRRVNWRASAKRGRLMVRQEEQRADPQCWLFLDTVGGRPERPSDAFEAAMELVASIGVHAMEHGFTLGIVESGLPQLEGEGVPFGADFVPPEGSRLLVAQLAALTPAPPATEPVGLFADALRRAGAGTPAFAVLVDGPAERWGELAGVRGLAEPAVAFLLTPEAMSAQQDLERVGWTCVAVPPGTGPAAAWTAASDAAARRIGAGRA